MCEDVTYAQAEVLYLAEKIKKSKPDPFIVGFPVINPQVTVQRFLAGYKNYPSELESVLALRATILENGFWGFVKRPCPIKMEINDRDSDVQLGRGMEEIAVGLKLAWDAGKDDENVDDVVELMHDIHANPLHAGVHQSFHATVMDADWISDAARAIRKFTPERWLRRLLIVMRFYFKGEPKVPLPHNNDHCPCGSSRKYGKCCGRGVEHEDPEFCKLGKHEYTSWEKISGKYVRSCERCYRVYDAPWFEESVFEGIKITVIGCIACGMKPTPDDLHKEIGQALVWTTCAYCDKPFDIESMLVEDGFQDGKHLGKWIATEINHREPAFDLESKSLGKGVFLHKECFMKALPAWPIVARPSGKGQAAEISRDVTPELPTGS